MTLKNNKYMTGLDLSCLNDDPEIYPFLGSKCAPVGGEFHLCNGRRKGQLREKSEILQIFHDGNSAFFTIALLEFCVGHFIRCWYFFVTFDVF